MSASRRLWALGLAVVVVVVAAATVVSGVLWGNAAADDEGTVDPSTATVERRTLQVVDELDGELGHGATQPVYARLPGTLTGEAAVGETVNRGEALFTVDEQPVTLLYGTLPAWRTLAEGSSGSDVRQLERNLRALGYADDLKPDGTFGADTARAVRTWQRAIGATVDGAVDFGEVIFLPEAAWVAEQQVTVGGQAAPGAPVLAVAGTDRLVTVNLAADRRDDVAEGDVLEVELSDGTATSGKVEDIAATVTTDPQSGSETVTVTIRLEGQLKDAADGPVTVSLVRQERGDVLAVPVNALLALLEGGYAVEVANDGESTGGSSQAPTRLVGVEVGLFADGWVEITDSTGGGLAEGDEVVVP